MPDYQLPTNVSTAKEVVDIIIDFYERNIYEGYSGGTGVTSNPGQDANSAGTLLDHLYKTRIAMSDIKKYGLIPQTESVTSVSNMQELNAIRLAAINEELLRQYMRVYNDPHNNNVLGVSSAQRLANRIRNLYDSWYAEMKSFVDLKKLNPEQPTQGIECVLSSQANVVFLDVAGDETLETAVIPEGTSLFDPGVNGAKINPTGDLRIHNVEGVMEMRRTGSDGQPEWVAVNDLLGSRSSHPLYVKWTAPIS